MARTVVIVAATLFGVCGSGHAECSAAPLESPVNPAPTQTASPEEDPAPPGVPGPAQPTVDGEDPRVGDAREAFRLGTLLAHQGRWADALEAFERSASLRSHPVTLYDIAYCERALARYTRAGKAFAAAIAAHEAGRGGRMGERMLAEARKYLADVLARLARARVTLVPPGAAIAVNGGPLEKARGAGTAPLFLGGTRGPGAPEPTGFESFEVLLDPGNQVFLVRSGEGEPTTITRQIPPGTTVSVVLRVHEARPAIASRTPGWAYAAYGLGAAGLAVGAGFGIAAFVRRSELDDVCGSPPKCPRSAGPDLDAARNDATVANVGLAVGALGAALGTTLLLTSGTTSREGEGRPAEHRRQSGVGTWIGIGSLGAMGKF
jgi:hypothetical protein